MVQFKIDLVSLMFGFEAVLDGVCMEISGRIYVTGLSGWGKYSACKQ
jgi:hypothetical protein